MDSVFFKEVELSPERREEIAEGIRRNGYHLEAGEPSEGDKANRRMTPFHVWMPQHAVLRCIFGDEAVENGLCEVSITLPEGVTAEEAIAAMTEESENDRGD